MNVGQPVTLKRDNLSGFGNKGDTGFIVDLLFKPVDGCEVVVKFANGGTEGFMKKDLEKAVKRLTKIRI